MKTNTISAFSLSAILCITALFFSCDKEDTPTLRGVPSITSAIVSTLLTDVRATGTLLSDGGSPITQWGVCWSTKTAPTTADHNVTAPVKGNSFNVVLPDLQPMTIYYVRCYAVNAEGTGYSTELSFVSGDMELTQKMVPDDVFRALLIERYDKNEDGILMLSDVSKLISLDVNDTKIASLEGIRYFYQLQELTCYLSKLTALDVSDLVNLKELNCASNLITTLDVSGCTELIRVECGSNKLTAIEMSSCKKTEYLDFSDNQLSTIDVSALIHLKDLSCRNNLLTTIDVSALINLERLGCEYNLLTAIDLSDCKKLINVNLEHNKLSTIDVSMLADLREISCPDNPLASLNVNGCTKLNIIRVYACKLTSVDVSSCVELWAFYGDNNQFSSLDVSACPKLENLYCGENQLSRLDVSKLTMLKEFHCNNNLLSSLDVSACAELKALFCQGNTNLNTISVSEQQNARKDAQGNIPGWEKPDQASYAPVDQIVF